MDLPANGSQMRQRVRKYLGDFAVLSVVTEVDTISVVRAVINIADKVRQVKRPWR